MSDKKQTPTPPKDTPKPSNPPAAPAKPEIQKGPRELDFKPDKNTIRRT